MAGCGHAPAPGFLKLFYEKFVCACMYVLLLFFILCRNHKDYNAQV